MKLSLSFLTRFTYSSHQASSILSRIKNEPDSNGYSNHSSNLLCFCFSFVSNKAIEQASIKANVNFQKKEMRN